MRRRRAARRCSRSRPRSRRPRRTSSSSSATRAGRGSRSRPSRRSTGRAWLVTGKEESPLAEAADEVLVVTPEIEKSCCHTASYTAAVAALAALRGDDVSGLPAAVERVLAEEPFPAFGHERVVVVGGGRDWPTAQEAVLKLREGAMSPAEAHHTEQILHGHLAAIDETVRVLRPRGRGPRRRARGRRRPRAGRDRRRDDPRPHGASRGRHRPLPAPHAGPGRSSQRRARHDPVGRAALGRGPSVLLLIPN